MHKNEEKEELIHGTIGQDKQGRDTYAFGDRATLILQKRIEQDVPENMPTPGGPWTVKFEPTPACDIQCHFCAYEISNSQQIKFYIDQRKAGGGATIGLTKESVMDTLEDLETGGNTRGTYWAGGGEPLIWPHITEAVLRASEFSDVFMQTNGTHLNKLTEDPAYLRAIRLLSLSSYGPDGETYKAVTSRDRFQTVDNNIRTVLDMRDKHGLNLAVNTKILVSPRNYKKLPETVAYFRSLGVDSLAVRQTQDFNIGSKGPRAESVELSMEQKQKIYQTITDFHGDDELLTTFAEALIRSDEEILPTRHCYSAIQSHFAVINPQGEIFIGDPETGNPDYSIGNITQGKWSDIWGSDRHLDVMKKMDLKQQAGVCNFAMCRHVKANQAVEAVVSLGELKTVNEAEVMENFGAFM